MRRIFALMLGLMLLVIPAVVGAQDNKLLWDLDGVFSVTDLGFQFNYPKDWVKDTSRGIRLAENADDLAAIVDTDESTQAKGYTLSVSAFPLDALGLAADAKLEDVVDMLVKVAGITETESRVEVPVITRRAITIIGTNSSDKPGLASIWLQDGNVVLFNLGAPKLNADVGYSWGTILGGMKPLDALNLGKKPLTSKDGDFTMSYPEGWFIGKEATNTIAEIESDLGSSATLPEGIASIVIEDKLTNFDKSVKDIDTLMDLLVTTQDWTDKSTIVREEHIILQQPAITLSGEHGSEGGWVELTGLVMGDKAVVIAVSYPSKERFDEFKPTHLAMLQSIEAPEKAS